MRLHPCTVSLVQAIKSAHDSDETNAEQIDCIAFEVRETEEERDVWETRSTQGHDVRSSD